MSIKYSITVTEEAVSEMSPIILRGSFDECFKIASDMGFDGVELQLCNPEDVDVNQISKLCKEYNLEISAIATGMLNTSMGLSLIDDNEKDRKRIVDYIKQHIDMASVLNTQVIIGCVRGNIPAGADRSIYINRLDDVLRDLCEYGKNNGVDLVLEAINFYVNNYLNSVPETVEHIKELGLPNLKLHIDTHHMNIEDEDMVESVLGAKGVMGYVHFASYNRLYPYDCRIPYREVYNALKEIGYSGFISMECVPKPDQITAGKRSIEYLKTL